jgi:hypothetical protein
VYFDGQKKIIHYGPKHTEGTQNDAKGSDLLAFGSPAKIPSNDSEQADHDPENWD